MHIYTRIYIHILHVHLCVFFIAVTSFQLSTFSSQFQFQLSLENFTAKETAKARASLPVLSSQLTGIKLPEQSFPKLSNFANAMKIAAKICCCCWNVAHPAPLWRPFVHTSYISPVGFACCDLTSFVSFCHYPNSFRSCIVCFCSGSILTCCVVVVIIACFLVVFVGAVSFVLLSSCGLYVSSALACHAGLVVSARRSCCAELHGVIAQKYAIHCSKQCRIISCALWI